MTRKVRVDLGERSYDVIVGRGAVSELATLIPTDVRRVAIVTQAHLPFDVAPHLPTAVAVSRHVVGDGEAHKTLATIERLTEEFAAAGLTRNDLVVGVGGGMVTDIAGFAAASWHRGIRVVHVSTTLVGMIDAAIGGKTGVNLAAGKNLVGAFWQPTGVVCDTAMLDTLPAREQRCGSGEMAKICCRSSWMRESHVTSRSKPTSSGKTSANRVVERCSTMDTLSDMPSKWKATLPWPTASRWQSA